MRVLCVDSGSSSLKFALYDMPSEQLVSSASVDFDKTGAVDSYRPSAGAEQASAFERILSDLHSHGLELDAIGHRVVFGGPDHTAPELAGQELLAKLEALVPYDPLHMPPALGVIRRARQLAPEAPQVVCFDSAFHRRMPELARRYPLPQDLGPMVQRYGYHGISYEYIVSTGLANGRAVIAHLGNGASLAAISDGSPVDTTMGFSPLGGLMMGTRPGDLDPGVLLYLLRSGGYDADKLSVLLNSRSGLLGASGSSADVRTLLSRAPTDRAAEDAIDLFVYLSVKHVGAMVAALGGIDTLIFTGGIGEHAADIRQAICAGCAYLGVRIDETRNNAPTPADAQPLRIAADDSNIAVFVVRTNENLMIARHVYTTVSALSAR